MADILIRDVPEDVIAAIDASARRAGLSRTEYLRRTLARERTPAADQTSMHDLASFSDTFGDLAEEDVMRHAWS